MLKIGTNGGVAHSNPYTRLTILPPLVYYRMLHTGHKSGNRRGGGQPGSLVTKPCEDKSSSKSPRLFRRHRLLD